MFVALFLKFTDGVVAEKLGVHAVENLHSLNKCLGSYSCIKKWSLSVMLFILAYKLLDNSKGVIMPQMHTSGGGK